MPEGDRLRGFLEAPRSLFVITSPNTDAGGRQSGQCSNFVQIAKLLCFIVQTELDLGHPLQDRRVLLGRFMTEPSPAANDHLLPTEYLIAIL